MYLWCLSINENLVYARVQTSKQDIKVLCTHAVRYYRGPIVTCKDRELGQMVFKKERNIAKDNLAHCNKQNVGCYCGHRGWPQTCAAYLLGSGETTDTFSVQVSVSLTAGNHEQSQHAEPRPQPNPLWMFPD